MGQFKLSERMVELRPATWVRLPGTDWEAYLKGKYQIRPSIVIFKDPVNARWELGFWTVPLDQVYLRPYQGDDPCT